MSERGAEPEPRDVAILCAECGQEATHVELIAPGQRPRQFEMWRRPNQEAFTAHHDPARWVFAYSGVEGGNGMGDDIDEAQAARLAYAFSEPVTYQRVITAGLYDDAGFCDQCECPYCYDHWNDPARPDGICPRGHGKSLDPHWSPVD